MTSAANSNADLAQLLSERSSHSYAGQATRQKVLVGIVAPTAVGKSTVISEILRQGRERGSDVGEVGSITTRARRSDGSDPQNYRTGSEGITHHKLIQDIKSGDLINWSLSPTGDLYATDAASYPATYNFLPLLPDSIDMLKRAGFQQFLVVYLTAPVEQWKTRLTGRVDDPNFAGRLREAIDSLTFAKEHRDTLCVLSNPSSDGAQPIALATAILDHLLQGTPLATDPAAIQNIEHMLQYAQERRNGTA